MKKLRHLIIAACVLFSNAAADQIEKADRFFEATLFDQAIPVYQELLKELHVNTIKYAHVKLQLAKAYYLSKQYGNVIETLSDIDLSYDNSNSKIHFYNIEATYLQGASYNRVHEYNNATVSLTKHFSLNGDMTHSYYDTALFELGLAFYQMEQFDNAKATFSRIDEKSSTHAIFIHSQIYLTRIAIVESNIEKAHSIIRTLQTESFSNPFIQYAIDFLHGELLFHEKRYKEAVSHFKKTISLKDAKQTDWSEDSLYYLGWCYLNLGEETEQILYFDQAIETFQRLINDAPSDRAKLSLGQTLLIKGKLFSEPNSFFELDSLLNDDRQFNTRNAKHHALLLRAEASTIYSDKKRFFKQLTSDNHHKSPLFSKAWYLRGLNELDEGHFLIKQERILEARKHLKNSVFALKKSFELLYPDNIKLAALALKQQAQAYYYQQTREESLKGLSVLSRLLNQYRDTLFPLLDQPDEVYFLQGVIASQLLDCNEGKTFFSIAENSLVHCIESYPKGAFNWKSLHLLGTLYYQNKDYARAENIFLELALLKPTPENAGEAWYWAAESAEKLNAPKAKVQQYRKKVYEQFPQSAFADEAYFRFFTYQEYLNGRSTAMEHLQNFSKNFPKSPIQMTAYYLIGLQALQKKEIPSALEAFQQSANIYTQTTIPHQKIEYYASVRYRALLEKALTLQSQTQNYAESEQILSLLHQELENPNNAIHSSKEHRKMEEECAFHLTSCYLIMNREKEAHTTLSKALEKYRREKITRGYHLSRAWYQNSILAMNQGDFHLALQSLKYAEDAAKGKVLNTDELLDLWIQQSLCHQHQDHMDEAMLILSKVINYDAVSSERLKAMFLRAEIYEKQGRFELARRQLEATAKKGGPWAMRAKTKLEENYVY